ncbi:MAG: DinB family protein [Actinoplanes sp.]
MADFISEDLSGSTFDKVDLRGASLRATNLSGASLRATDLSGARFHSVDFSGATMRGVELVDVDINGEIHHLTINGVDVVPLINAELDRRDPDRVKMRPEDPAGFREAWEVIERLWTGTIERARQLDPALLHESVGGEWSFIETLRHLPFATDAWVTRAILGDPAPWHPLDLPWDEMPDKPGIPRDREARPALDEVLELRHSRMTTVREVIDNLTEKSLVADTEPVEGDSWPPPRSFPVKECLRIVLNEEWEHRLYAERDLAVLETRPTAAGRP